MQEPVLTPEIANIGLKVEIDKETGRPKLVNTSDVSIPDLKVHIEYLYINANIHILFS
jgi:hypothetical protein